MSRAIEYVLWVPVHVTVADGEVERVVVDDENPVGGWEHVRSAVEVDEDGNRTHIDDDAPEVVEAIEVANDDIWPSWEFGF